VNGRERILAAVGFQPTDRVPCIPLVFGHAAVSAGIPLADYLRDGDCLARCQLAAQDRYGYDAVYAFMDTYVETEAMGSTLCFSPGLYPNVTQYALRSGDLPPRLKMPDPARDGRMPEVLKAAAALHRAAGDRLLVVGAVTGPMSLATTLMPLDEALYFFVDAPEAFSKLLDHATELAIAFGLAQIRAGAQAIAVLDPSSSPAVIPPKAFHAHVLSRLAKIMAAFRNAGALAWLDIAGPIAPLLSALPGIGLDIVTLDYEVSFTEGRQQLPHTCLAGNVRSLDFVLATPEQIFDTVCAVRAEAGTGGLLLSSGSEVPLEAKPDNLHAMLAACAGDAPCPN
jgi:uroporphyrinogen decarboxylase